MDFFKKITLIFLLVLHNFSYAAKINYTIYSDFQTLLPDGDIKAFGNVHAVSGEMVIDADEAIHHRHNPNEIYITATGNPIKYRGVTSDGKKFTGVSKKLKYTPASGEVLLTDNVFLQQNGNNLSADIVTYNTITKKMTASSFPGNKVKSVFSPNNYPR